MGLRFGSLLFPVVHYANSHPGMLITGCTHAHNAHNVPSTFYN